VKYVASVKRRKYDASSNKFCHAVPRQTKRTMLFEQLHLRHSAKGAQYDSQGQARSEAERVAPGTRQKKGVEP
jgi:hypothetical protein